MALIVAVVAFGAAVFLTATGGFGKIAGSLGGAMAGLLDHLSATPSPRPSVVAIAGAPVIAAPAEPYTNQKKVDLTVTVPAEVLGQKGTTVRIYLALPDQAPAPITQVPLASTPTVVVPVDLTDGQNDFTATVVGPGGESDHSPVVTFILDTAAPRISITSPAVGSTVNRTAVVITGRTQARSAIVARNEANAASATAVADSNGTFTFTMALNFGTNGITITATDPAGNATTAVVSYRRGSGKLTASLSASSYRLSARHLPATLELTVTVTDPDGKPLEGADVTFTLSIPGIQVVTSDATTGGDGRATFRTTVPKGATLGTGPAAALVTTQDFGTTSDQTVITVSK